MLFYLSLYLRDYETAFNALTYHTVRAGGAAITAFLFCLLFGPFIIQWLRALKVGQFIRKEHVADLHELHKGKAGTPTMGGALIVTATLGSLLLWSTLTNRLLIIAVAIFTILGAVGFLDDYIKLRRKHNAGLSAKAKLIGQLMVGAGAGLYLVYFPITVSAAFLQPAHVEDWRPLVHAVFEKGNAPETLARRQFVHNIDPALAKKLDNGQRDASLLPDLREAFVIRVNENLTRPDLYQPALWPPDTLGPEAATLLAQGVQKLSGRQLVRLNRLLFEKTFPDAITHSVPNLHTKVNIPGLKDVFIPMGALYALFVTVIIVSTSNAVNLTDGLDGLAVGASAISLLAYTGISYVISRADWSSYLYLTYVPEASELTVFGAALLGSGLGFLWYNSHPAEVFMGDTGSLALGGALGAMAILTKQELLLILVGGLFVIEAGSVVLQVVSFKLTGKRLFRMAPLHHHFELKGWSETKVTIRFWILALLFAMMSLATLKLR